MPAVRRGAVRASAQTERPYAQRFGGDGEASVERHQRVIAALADGGMQGVGRPEASVGAITLASR